MPSLLLWGGFFLGLLCLMKLFFFFFLFFIFFCLHFFGRVYDVFIKRIKRMTYTILNRQDNDMTYECDCCNKEMPAKRMIWIKDNATGQEECYGKTCWKKMKERGEV